MLEQQMTVDKPSLAPSNIHGSDQSQPLIWA
jgi:hypothetical protein